MSDAQGIQWFPGHMAKTRRKITESLSLVDAVAEIVDSRIPVSSRNPELAGIIAGKPHIVLLNKCDMADINVTKRWIDYYKQNGKMAIAVDCKSGKGVSAFSSAIKSVLAEKLEFYRAKGMVGKPLRIMIVGIPNVGKSSFINRMAHGSKAKVEDRPGVTRGNQWYRIEKDLDLLDTPGVLWPKFEDATVGEHLAFTGAVKDNVIDIETLAVHLCEYLAKNYGKLLTERYKIQDLSQEPNDLLCEIGKKRGMIIRGGSVDTERASTMLLDEFRSGKLGAITLESPE
ncbi:MAG: ribosome biogenesis GTPase YlqF [Oscillospiraceae bacterium]|nr:ribosome biogenesis GTPase YlqF [Oscillospiraceae bacterium]